MNWEAIGAFAELTGAIAVVASLFYVGVQVRGNSRAIRGQTFDSISSSLNDAVFHMITDTNLLDIIGRAVRNQDLVENEALAYSGWLIVVLRSVESAHHQCELGLLDDKKLKPLVENMGLHFSSVHGRRLWDSRRHLYDPKFCEFIDDLVKHSDRDKILNGVGYDA